MTASGLLFSMTLLYSIRVFIKVKWHFFFHYLKVMMLLLPRKGMWTAWTIFLELTPHYCAGGLGKA